MGLFDFLKGGNSSGRSNRTSRKEKSSSSISGKITRAEKSAINKKLWAEKRAKEDKTRSSTKATKALKKRDAKQPDSTAANQPTTRAERSRANKKAWAEKKAKEKAERAATQSDASKSTADKNRRGQAQKLTRAERSALNKKAWAEERIRRNADGGSGEQATTPTANTRFQSEAKITSAPAADSSLETEKLTRAQRSAANKRAWAEMRAQQEAEGRIERERRRQAKSERGRRKSAFPNVSAYREYLNSDGWKETRRNVEDRAQGRCEICGKRGSHVHHRRYSPPGKEKNSDLLFVCVSCHKQIHRT